MEQKGGWSTPNNVIYADGHAKMITFRTRNDYDTKIYKPRSR
jgi:prepilin-type processing-associated H-X9-DG protein